MKNDISALPQISEEEINLLRKAKIETSDALWKQVGMDSSEGIALVAERAGLTTKRLTQLLTLAAAQEANAEQSSWVRRNWREGLAVLSLVVIGLLTLRAAGKFLNLPSPFALQSKVVVPMDNLKAGRVLREGDIRLVAWTESSNAFHKEPILYGLVLAHAVSRGKPLTQEDVLSLQVVAATDVPKDKPLTAAMVTTKWLPYDAAAATQPDAVIGHKAHCPLRKDAPVLEAMVDPTRFSAPQPNPAVKRPTSVK